MVELAMNPMLEARYTPLTPPDFRIFYKASGIRFLGAPDLELITDWVLRKIGLPNNRIRSQREIRDKLSKSSLLTVFVSEKHKADDEFNNYLEVSRRLLTLNDVEFAYAFIEDFEKEIGNLGELVESNFYKRWGFSVRVYRRGNIADFKDMRYANLYDPAEVTAEDIERFIFRSTFVGDGPDFIREANTENVMKFFHQSQAGLFLFYNSALVVGEQPSEQMKRAVISLEEAFDEISGKVIIMKCDVNSAIC